MKHSHSIAMGISLTVTEYDIENHFFCLNFLPSHSHSFLRTCVVASSIFVTNYSNAPSGSVLKLVNKRDICILLTLCILIISVTAGVLNLFQTESQFQTCLLSRKQQGYKRGQFIKISW
jgi:hypothetical protein